MKRLLLNWKRGRTRNFGESSRYSDDEAENFMMKPDRNPPGTLWDSLRSYKLPREATTELLHILDNYGVNRYHQLPLHCRTLTSIEGNPNYDIRNKSGVEYFFLGVENQLRHVLKRYPLEVREEVDHICFSKHRWPSTFQEFWCHCLALADASSKFKTSYSFSCRSECWC